MKRTTLTIVVLACLVVLLLLVTAFTAVSTASAQLGNTGIPVLCATGITPGNFVNPICQAADGTSFTTVPTGHYFLVTDVILRPYGPATGMWNVGITMKGPAADVQQYFEMVTQTQVTSSEHFVSPYLVIPQGKYLSLYNYGTSGTVYLFVSGLLTTSVSYLPAITR